jgi:hypothetical protein
MFRWNLSRPLAELTVAHAEVGLVRGLVAKVCPVSATLTLSSIQEAFRLSTSGVGMSTGRAEKYYFWTAQAEQVLASLRRHDVAVRDEARFPRNAFGLVEGPC